MNLLPWSHQSSAGFTLRGWHSEPSGKPVLHFLHGNGYCGRVYQPLLEALGRDFDLWLCDIQGHGDSDHGGRFLGWNRSAALAFEAFAAFEAQRPLFNAAPCYATGHSFGGVLTALMLSRQPQAFERAVLLDPVLFTPTMIGVMALSDVVGLYRRNTMASKARSRRRQWPNREAAAQDLYGRGMFRGWQDDAFNAYIEHALRDIPEGVELKCAPEREAEIFSSFPRRLWSHLRQVQTPTQVLYGQKSYPFVAKAVSRWCAINSRLSAQVVEGGHCFMQEHPEASAQRVTQYLLQRV